MEQEKLGIYEFGKQLIETRDLDPVYVLLHQSGMWGHQLKQWLLAYWCFYHVGTACWIVEQPAYWTALLTAATFKDYPRGSERRHFRAANALESVTYLSGEGIDNLLDPLLESPHPDLEKHSTVQEVMSVVQQWTGFGPWIAFKVADMLECLGLASISFDRGSAFLFDSPKEGARLMWKRYAQGSNAPPNVEEWAVNVLCATLGKLKAPPRYERVVGVQEAETVLCKWKSYLNGHYHVGKDTTELRHSLLRFTRVKLAQRLLRAGEEAKLW